MLRHAKLCQRSFFDCLMPEVFYGDDGRPGGFFPGGLRYPQLTCDKVLVDAATGDDVQELVRAWGYGHLYARVDPSLRKLSPLGSGPDFATG